MTTSPSTQSISFNCPHCHVLAQQFWWGIRAHAFNKDGHPFIWTKEIADERIEALKDKAEKINLDVARAALYQKATGEVSLGEKPVSSYDYDVTNVWLSKCYACDQVAVWIYDRLVHPISYDAPQANPDTPVDVLADYTEAAQIAPLSPRGAAALLRLAIQRLMPHLGQTSGNLNADIAALVEGGMDVRIQRSLDIVRVVGNNAVHPGQIDLKDNRDTVATLFKLVNVIVDTTISQPKHIEAAYGDLPEGARKAIEERDKSR